MAIESLFTSGAIVAHDTALAQAVGFAGLVSQQIELGQEIRTQKKFGSVYDSGVSISSRSPTVVFATTQIHTLLGLTQGLGRCIRSDGTHPGLDAWLIPHSKCQARDLAAALRYRIAEGYLAPQSLTVDHRGTAQITAQAIAASKQGNEPLTEAYDLAAPGGVVDTEAFTLYRQTIGGYELTGVKQMQVDFGVDLTVEAADGAPFPEWISVNDVVTRVTLTGVNLRWLGDAVIPKRGLKLTHANTELRLAAYQQNDAGPFKPLDEAHHITMTAAGLAVLGTAATAGDSRQVATNQLMLYLIHDGVNAPLRIDTGVTLEN